MLYKVTKKYMGGSESPVGSYKTIEEAKQIIQEKLAQDKMQKVNATYCLYEFFDLIEEYNQSMLEESGEDTTGGRSQGNTFRPTPFNTSPQPKGLPRSWGRGEDDQDKDK